MAHELNRKKGYMITRVKLSEFKAHEALDLADIPSIAVLIGRNNTGKSAVLHAAAMPRYGLRYDPYLPIGTVDQIARKPGGDFRVELTYGGSAPGFLVVRPNRQTLPMSIASEWQGNRTTPAATGVFYISALRTTSESFGYGSLTEDVGVTGEETNNILHQLKANDDQRFVSIVSWLSRMNLGITLVGTPTRGAQGAIEPTSFGTRTNLVMHGSGTWSVLPIVVQGILAKREQTLLIEEPESHLHRAAIDTLWLFLSDCAKRGVQSICTTHSLDLLVSLGQRVQQGEVPPDSAIFHLRRDASGKTTATRRDPAVFRGISEVVKRDLAGHDY